MIRANLVGDKLKIFADYSRVEYEYDILSLILSLLFQYIEVSTYVYKMYAHIVHGVNIDC